MEQEEVKRERYGLSEEMEEENKLHKESMESFREVLNSMNICYRLNFRIEGDD